MAWLEVDKLGNWKTRLSAVGDAADANHFENTGINGQSETGLCVLVWPEWSAWSNQNSARLGWKLHSVSREGSLLPVSPEPARLFVYHIPKGTTAAAGQREQWNCGGTMQHQTDRQPGSLPGTSKHGGPEVT